MATPKDIEAFSDSLKPLFKALVESIRFLSAKVEEQNLEISKFKNELDVARMNTKLSVKVVDSFSKLSDAFIAAPVQHKIVTLAVPFFSVTVLMFMLMLIAVSIAGESPTEFARIFEHFILTLFGIAYKMEGNE